MLSSPKYLEQHAQHFPAIFYLLCRASQHHVCVTLCYNAHLFHNTIILAVVVVVAVTLFRESEFHL